MDRGGAPFPEGKKRRIQEERLMETVDVAIAPVILH
jgi:hypothetical protein